MHFINQDWIIKFIFGLVIAWVGFGAIALFAFMRCQYCDRKITDSRITPWSFFGIENFWIFFFLVLVGLSLIVAWPILIKEKRNYELGIPPDYSLN